MAFLVFTTALLGGGDSINSGALGGDRRHVSASQAGEIPELPQPATQDESAILDLVIRCWL